MTSQDKPAWLSKAKAARRANLVVISFAIGPVVYLIIAGLLELASVNIATTRQSFVQLLFFALAVVSLGNIALTVYITTSSRLLSGRYSYGPIWGAFQRLAIGAILSESHAIYGLILTFLSGSILYLLGFSLVAWASLLWVRGRFTQNLAKLPDS